VVPLKFGAFPRSGSHFFVHLTNCEWLSHRIAPLATSTNVVVSIRDPLECVPSWIVLTNDNRPDRAEKVLEWYCAYYAECLRLDLLLLSFTELVEKPMECVEFVGKHFGIDIDVPSFDLSSGFHKPTTDKSKFDTIISEMKTAPSFGLSIKLFNQLSSKQEVA